MSKQTHRRVVAPHAGRKSVGVIGRGRPRKPSTGTAVINKRLQSNMQPIAKLTAQQGAALQQAGSKTY